MNNQELLLDNRISNIENMLSNINRNLELNKPVKMTTEEKINAETAKFYIDIPGRLALIWGGEEAFFKIFGIDEYFPKSSIQSLLVKSIIVISANVYAKDIAESIITPIAENIVIPTRDFIADGINYTKDTIIDTYHNIHDYISPTGEIHYSNHVHSEIYG